MKLKYLDKCEKLCVVSVVLHVCHDDDHNSLVNWT